MIKQIVVQADASMFIRKLLMKLALLSSFHTFFIHNVKKMVIGNIHIVKVRNERMECSF